MCRQRRRSSSLRAASRPWRVPRSKFSCNDDEGRGDGSFRTSRKLMDSWNWRMASSSRMKSPSSGSGAVWADEGASPPESEAQVWSTTSISSSSTTSSTVAARGAKALGAVELFSDSSIREEEEVVEAVVREERMERVLSSLFHCQPHASRWKPDEPHLWANAAWP